ncbi:DUF5977 domain-containing protein [Parapedobacter tibetensis]|uniref:DUF5977 domain-containing protein n=1 Tax=Parapedobacter tibetensis TaxID=2972951 RepID=UPI00214D1C53|nr:DUF5977 domain-containing protein [Parapedobacter tibetensis]
MKNWTINWIMVMLYMITTQVLYSQIPTKPLSAPSPNAASLGLYGEYPVSYFTGVPTINIPLHVLSSGDVSLPISLDYHASGVRPDLHPGWVGLGWNLFAGGAITRKPHDLVDEYNHTHTHMGINAGFYFNHAVLNVSNWSSLTYMNTILNGGQANSPFHKDTEPDEFSFSVAGMQGAFYMGHDGQWKVRSERPLKVEFDGVFLPVPFSPPMGSAWINLGGYIKSFSGFTITDEHGVRYIFGGTTDAIEYSIGFFNQNDGQWTADTWYLTKIIYPLGEEVSFVYERDDFINQMSISLEYVESVTLVVNQTTNYCNEDAHNTILNAEGTLVSPVYLSSITCKNEVIRFVRSTTSELRYSTAIFDYHHARFFNEGNYLRFLPFLELPDEIDPYPASLTRLQWKQLDQIRIEVDGQFKKAFDFTYSSNSSQRLTLLSIQEMGGDNGSQPPYAFCYDTSVPLPQYLAHRNDHWGFYSGRLGNIANAATYHDSRQPTATYLRAGSLRRIAYPTGGVTDFVFEPHYYRSKVPAIRWQSLIQLSSNTLAGGLRIRKIISYDPQKPNEKVEKEYFYVRNYTNTANIHLLPSSGILGGESQYYFLDYQVKSADGGSTYSKRVFSVQSALPASLNSHGTHIGYSHVVERLGDGSYSIYDFSNFDSSGYQDQSPLNVLHASYTPYSPYRSRTSHRGKLIDERHYSTLDKLLKRRTVSYIALNEVNEQIRSLKINVKRICASFPINSAEGSAYVHYTYAFLPSSETLYDYEQNSANATIVTKNYTYDNTHRLLKQETTTDSRGRTTQVNYRYVFDVHTNYNNMYSDAQFYPYSYLIRNHNIATPVEVVQTLVEGGTERITNVSTVTHKGEKLYEYPSFHWRTVPHTAHELDVLLPVATSSYSPFSVTRTGSTEVHNMDTDLLKVLEYEFAPSRTYNTTKLVGIIDASGKANSTIYGQFMKYPIAQVSGAHFLECAYSSFETNSNDGDWRGGGGQIPLRYSDQDAPVGSFCTNNAGTSGYITTYDKQLSAGKTYVLTFWEKGGGVSIRNSGAVVVSNTILLTKGAWQQREIRCRNVSGNLEITPTGYIDDLRLYPLGSLMESYTYNQLGSLTASTDSRGATTYYDYDEFNRLRFAKDYVGNVIQAFGYNYRSGGVDCGGTIFINAERTQAFAKNDCVTGYQGSQVAYTVHAGKYSSTISQAAANQLAQDEINSAGQAFANQNGTCVSTSPRSIYNSERRTVEPCGSFPGISLLVWIADDKVPLLAMSGNQGVILYADVTGDQRVLPGWYSNLYSSLQDGGMQRMYEVGAGGEVLGYVLCASGSGPLSVPDPVEEEILVLEDDPSGHLMVASWKSSHFEYDGFGRFKTAKNLNGHIVEEYKYNYRP